MLEQDPLKMSHEEMIDTLKGLVFGMFDRTTAKEHDALDMVIKALDQEFCEDCVSRAELLKIYENRFIELQKAHQMDKQLGINWCINTLKGLPSVIPQEPKTGRWIRQTDDYHDYYECDHCGIAVGLDDIKNFCPNCGAKMKSEG